MYRQINARFVDYLFRFSYLDQPKVAPEYVQNRAFSCKLSFLRSVSRLQLVVINFISNASEMHNLENYRLCKRSVVRQESGCKSFFLHLRRFFEKKNK